MAMTAWIWLIRALATSRSKPSHGFGCRVIEIEVMALIGIMPRPQVQKQAFGDFDRANSRTVRNARQK
jgi:hypothetical protein